MVIGHHWYCYWWDRLMLWSIKFLSYLILNVLFLLRYLVVIFFGSGQRLILAMRQNDFV